MLICFIDDDNDFEIPLFHEVFGSQFDVISGTTIKEVQKKLKRRKPELFVLDLYFPLGPKDDHAIQGLSQAFPQIVADGGDMRKAYINYLFMADRLKQVLSAHKQGPKGGIDLCRKVTNAFPNVPIVFYSRKATLEDAVRCMGEEKVYNVLQKPTGKEDEDTRRLTKQESDRLSSEFMNAVTKPSSSTLQMIKGALPSLIRYLQPFIGQDSQ